MYIKPPHMMLTSLKNIFFGRDLPQPDRESEFHDHLIEQSRLKSNLVLPSNFFSDGFSEPKYGGTGTVRGSIQSLNINNTGKNINGSRTQHCIEVKSQESSVIEDTASRESFVEIKEEISSSEIAELNHDRQTSQSSLNSIEDSQSLAIVASGSELAQSGLDNPQSHEFGPVKVYLDQAALYSSAQKWEEAIAACQNALQVSPNEANAYKVWGNILQRKGETTEAMGYYAKALVIQPDFPEVYANLGSLYATQEQWEQAIAYYQKAIELNPGFAGAYRNLAKIWRKLNDLDQQAQCLICAFAIDPSVGTAEEYYQLGNQLFESGNLTDAMRAYQAAIQIEPDHLLACNKLAEVLEQQGDWKSAVTYYRQVLDIRAEQVTHQQAPRQPLKAIRLGDQKGVQKQGNAPDTQPLTVQNFTPPVVAQPHSSSCSEGETSIAPSDSKAQALLEAAMAQPKSEAIRIELGNYYLDHENWEQAISAYKSALRLNPRLADVYLKLAKAFKPLGKQGEMAEALYRAFELDVSLATASQHLSLGQTFQDQKNYEKALLCYRRSLQVNPNSLEAYRCLGDALKFQGKTDEALEAYQRALQYTPKADVKKNV